MCVHVYCGMGDGNEWISYSQTDGDVHPGVPEGLTRPFVRKQGRKRDDPPHVLEGRRETETDPDDAELSAHGALKIFECHARVELGHLIHYAQQGRGTAWITHAPGTQRDVARYRDVLDERVWDQVTGGLPGYVCV